MATPWRCPSCGYDPPLPPVGGACPNCSAVVPVSGCGLFLVILAFCIVFFGGC